MDNGFRNKLQAAIAGLAPMQIGKHSQLQEWMIDLDRPDDKHRHISHLYGLYPGNQISPYRTPELFDAARTSLVYRGDPATGWSMGWKVNLWARFLDGNHAYKLITDQLKLVGGRQDSVNTKGGGTYPNMFDAHPPLHIVGNLRCTAGIAEKM
jgi:alpha-L-fucosidase 2